MTYSNRMHSTTIKTKENFSFLQENNVIATWERRERF
jgi:hypothetical protein